MINFSAFFCSALIIFLSGQGEGLRCYTCSHDRCLTEPWNLTGNPIRTCFPHVKFCIIVRIESKETGKVTSFLRKCEENPVADSDVDSSIVVARYRFCTTDLCNKGGGLDFIDEGFEGDSVSLLVPDRSFSPRTSVSFSILLPHSFLSAPRRQFQF